MRPAAGSFVSRVCKRAQDNNEKSLKRSSKQQEVIILQINIISDYFLKADARFLVLRRLFCVHIKLIFGGGNNIGNDIAVLLCFFLNQNLKKHCKILCFIVEYIRYETRRQRSDFLLKRALKRNQR